MSELGGGERVYAELRRAILRLEVPPGAELEEGALSRQFAVSRTPVREALIRLGSEGLVNMQRGRGARVASLDLATLRDFFEGLDILQRTVTRLAASRRREADLAKIERPLHGFEHAAAALDNTAANEANYAFHRAIADAAQSHFLGAAYARVLSEGLRITHLCFSEHAGAEQRLPSHFAATIEEHRTMFAAIRDGDAEAAERVAGSHVLLFKNRVATTLMSTAGTLGLSAKIAHA
jgi:DNA-binding GntR family transcriptional regulator